MHTVRIQANCSSPKPFILIRKGSSSQRRADLHGLARVNGCQTAGLTILSKHSMEVSNGCGSTGSICINCMQSIRKCRLKNPSALSSKCRTQEKFGTLDYQMWTEKKSIAHARSLPLLAC